MGSIYVNGSLFASGPFNSSGAYTGDAHIAVANDGTAHFGGTIDEVAVYNYALLPDRVLAHYLTGISSVKPVAYSMPNGETGRSATMMTHTLETGALLVIVHNSLVVSAS